MNPSLVAVRRAAKRVKPNKEKKQKRVTVWLLAFVWAHSTKMQLNKMKICEANQSVSISSYTFLINDNPRGIHD